MAVQKFLDADSRPRPLDAATRAQALHDCGDGRLRVARPSGAPVDRVWQPPRPPPVKRVARAMFEAPLQLDDELKELKRFLDNLENTEPQTLEASDIRGAGAAVAHNTHLQ